MCNPTSRDCTLLHENLLITTNLDCPLTFGQWFLYIMPSVGWNYTWVAPLIITVIVLSILASALLAAAMLSYRQHQILLHNL